MRLPRRPILTLLALACCVAAAIYVAELINRARRLDAEEARKVLAEDGYEAIVVSDKPTLYSVLAGCDRHYDFITPFAATLAGGRAEGVVCSGGAWGRAPQVRRSR